MDALLDFINNNLIIIGGGALGGFVGFLLSYKYLGKIFRMIRTSTGEIANLPTDEQVEVVGKAESQTILESPITKTSCVFWQILVSEKRSSGKSSRWVIVHTSESTKPFDVHDGTGRVRVHPGRGLELVLRDDVKKSSGIFTSFDEQTRATLTEIGVETKGFLNMNKPMRVQERYIEQGDEIYLLGKTFSRSGTRVMDSTDSSLIVSDQSELRLLGKFGWQVVVNIVIGIIVGIVLSFYFTLQ